MAAELDYAYLAEFAKAERGTLTAVGASFTQVTAKGFPAHLPISIAGRVRRLEDDTDPSLRIVIQLPGRDAAIETTLILTSTEDAVVYDGKVANAFAVSAPIMASEPGLCEVDIYLNDEHVRRLAFGILDTSE